jgi:hypothetical protein
MKCWTQPQDDVLVFRCVHVVAHLVGGQPQLGLKPQVCAGIVLLGLRHLFRHFPRKERCIASEDQAPCHRRPTGPQSSGVKVTAPVQQSKPGSVRNRKAPKGHSLPAARLGYNQRSS